MCLIRPFFWKAKKVQRSYMKLPIKIFGCQVIRTVCSIVFPIIHILNAPLAAQSTEEWECLETVMYSVYEDTSLTESKSKNQVKYLHWIDQDTIALEAHAHHRVGANSQVFLDLKTGSTIFLNEKEISPLVVLTQPQTWMNKFGNLRVRFYRCTPNRLKDN